MTIVHELDRTGEKRSWPVSNVINVEILWKITKNSRMDVILGKLQTRRLHNKRQSVIS
jgi:hypothetical protein